mmetsp:Transcript_15163/g.40908  ORF Transcript_15163/g.40908 Transcript_15163/m.40908 type:complete len:112 (+) Transcript_15163:1682-2017(+)
MFFSTLPGRMSCGSKRGLPMRRWWSGQTTHLRCLTRKWTWHDDLRTVRRNPAKVVKFACQVACFLWLLDVQMVWFRWDWPEVTSLIGLTPQDIVIAEILDKSGLLPLLRQP